jgi:hypothetical protein
MIGTTEVTAMTVTPQHEPEPGKPVDATPGERPAQPAARSTARGQGLVLRTRFFVLDWTLRFTRTTVMLDGHRHDVSWGEHFFPLEPGRHHLQVSYSYLRLFRAGKASVLFDVAPNQLIEASYRAPRSVLVAFLPGKLIIEPSAQP